MSFFTYKNGEMHAEGVALELSVTNPLEQPFGELAALVPCFNPGPTERRTHALAATLDAAVKALGYRQPGGQRRPQHSHNDQAPGQDTGVPERRVGEGEARGGGLCRALASVHGAGAARGPRFQKVMRDLGPQHALAATAPE